MLDRAAGAAVGRLDLHSSEAAQLPATVNQACQPAVRLTRLLDVPGSTGTTCRRAASRGRLGRMPCTGMETARSPSDPKRRLAVKLRPPNVFRLPTWLECEVASGAAGPRGWQVVVWWVVMAMGMSGPRRNPDITKAGGAWAGIGWLSSACSACRARREVLPVVRMLRSCIGLGLRLARQHPPSACAAPKARFSFSKLDCSEARRYDSSSASSASASGKADGGQLPNEEEAEPLGKQGTTCHTHEPRAAWTQPYMRAQQQDQPELLHSDSSTIPSSSDSVSPSDCAVTSAAAAASAGARGAVSWSGSMADSCSKSSLSSSSRAESPSRSMAAVESRAGKSVGDERGLLPARSGSRYSAVERRKTTFRPESSREDHVLGQASVGLPDSFRLTRATPRMECSAGLLRERAAQRLRKTASLEGCLSLALR